MARHYRSVAMVIATVARDARPMAAGNIPFAVCKNDVCITCENDVYSMQKCFLHTRRAPAGSRWRGTGEWPAAEAQGPRPAGRTANGLRPTNGLTAGTTACGRTATATPCGRIMHPNQELVPGVGLMNRQRIMHLNQERLKRGVAGRPCHLALALSLPMSPPC